MLPMTSFFQHAYVTSRNNHNCICLYCQQFECQPLLAAILAILLGMCIKGEHEDVKLLTEYVDFMDF